VARELLQRTHTHALTSPPSGKVGIYLIDQVQQLGDLDTPTMSSCPV
jgi:hypothetical protein